MSTTSWSDLAGFANKVNKDDMKSAFNENVGRAYFDLGEHDVIIESVEPRVSKAGNSYASLTLKNDAGAEIRTNVMLSEKDGKPHFTYGNLGRACLSDPELQMQLFGDMIPNNLAMLDSIRGFRVKATIGNGREGYLVVKNPLTDGFRVVDAATKEPFPEVGDKVFSDYSQIKEEMDELRINRCYNEVKKLSRGNEDAVKANEEAVSEILRNTDSEGDKPARKKSGAVIPMV